jgi:hypothetical protein
VHVVGEAASIVNTVAAKRVRPAMAVGVACLVCAVSEAVYLKRHAVRA